jgi:hypothetical protein
LANKQILVMALNPGFVTPKNLNYFDWFTSADITGTLSWIEEGMEGACSRGPVL